MNACHAATTGYFCRELAMETKGTVYATTGTVKENNLGGDWVEWLTFAEGGETEPITWKAFFPDGTAVDLHMTVMRITPGQVSPQGGNPD